MLALRVENCTYIIVESFARRRGHASSYYFILTHNNYLVCIKGGCDVSKESILWITSKQGVGNAAIIVIGGADEALEAKPESFILTLKRRKGFCKLALRTG